MQVSEGAEVFPPGPVGSYDILLADGLVELGQVTSIGSQITSTDL
jgi:hypothetical protein